MASGSSEEAIRSTLLVDHICTLFIHCGELTGHPPTAILLMATARLLSHPHEPTMFIGHCLLVLANPIGTPSGECCMQRVRFVIHSLHMLTGMLHYIFS
jgi:hypothetical protein